MTQISGGKYSASLRFRTVFTASLIATDQRFSQPEMRDLRRLLKYLRPHWPIFTLATLAMLLVGVLESAIGGLIVPIFDQAFVQGVGQRTSTIFGLQHLIPQAPFGAWKMISILLIVFTLAKGIAEYLSTYLMARIGQSAVLKLRQDLYSHLLAQSATFFERHRTNYLVSRLVSSAAAIETADHQYYPRHVTREFHADRVSVGVILLQLAINARIACDCSGYRRAHCEVWQGVAQSRA